LVLWRVWADRGLSRQSVLGGWDLERGVGDDAVAAAGGGRILLERGQHGVGADAYSPIL
jgi:hypothetical protein